MQSPRPSFYIRAATATRYLPAENSRRVTERASRFIQHYREAIDWVVRRFGRVGASELELLSTIVYVDRELSKKRDRTGVQDLANMVQEVKPYFAAEYIAERVEQLTREGLLHSIENARVNAS